jgi:REP element-mobilizing transposase RayT
MHDDEPIAFFITWTVYGTFLQGDPRGWRKRRKGNQTPQPNLARWRSEKLKHRIELLDDAQRATIETEIDRLAAFRIWHVWTREARTNHVHVVVTAIGYKGSRVRDQFKANCTRVLREQWQKFDDRPVWTTGGDWQCINNGEELEQVIAYVSEAQDLMHLDEFKKRTGRTR